ncbi:(2Fe-2S)-binding protein [Alphaproteobacteria bacterium]|jgi:aerobic-type carbon monoxide dehydrogenase small subunit (CoxS/CutS family)|nr:(2Fe-2S)-binding protein [Alphaproteobacteria bacterium]|tara:strand:+ start:355 stop:831 length:477 start_codon:yes stop_codon:yes gene_type:complete
MSIKNSVNISLSVNGESFDNVTVPTRQHLADFLRSQGLTGTHLGCEQGACGACTIEMDGKAVRSCLILASQANGSSITTVEGFDDEVMEKVKNNFLKHNAFQCGFCSPGMLMTTKEIISSKKKLSRDEIRSEISGNYCRCTGYQSIVDAIEESINEIN